MELPNRDSKERTNQPSSRGLGKTTLDSGTFPVLFTTYFNSTGDSFKTSGPGAVLASCHVVPLSMLMYTVTTTPERKHETSLSHGLARGLQSKGAAQAANKESNAQCVCGFWAPEVE